MNKPCPRAYETGFNIRPVAYLPDGTCDYCGSLSGDVLMAMLEAGTATLGPTDKNYKVYVDHAEPKQGKPRIVSSASFDCSDRGYVFLTAENIDTVCAGFEPDDREYAAKWYLGHWVQVSHYGAIKHSKFYFQHLSSEQQVRFVELLNEKKLKLGEPGYFYRVPFFMTPISKG